MRDFHKTRPSGSGAAKIIPLVKSEATGVKPEVLDVTKEESSKSEAKSWGNDEYDTNNDQDSSSDGSDEKNDSDDDKTQSDNENESDSEHETDEYELGSESDQEVNEEDEDDEEEVKDELVKTPSNESDDEDEIKITDKAEVFSTIIPQSFLSFTPPLQQSTSTPPPTTEATNPPFTLPNFASVFQFNNKVTTLEKEVAELKKDPLHTQVTALVDGHLDTRLGATKEEFMNFLSASLTARITKHIKNQLPQILPEEAAAMLTKFELKKILIYKMDKSESYLAAPEHIYCYEGLIKSYDLDKTILSTYGKVYSLKRSQKDKDKDEDPSAGSDRGLKKRKASKDTESTKGPKVKEPLSGSSKGTKYQSKSSRKSVQSEEPEFKVADSDMPQDQEENLGKEDREPKEKVASKRNWFTKPTQPKEPIDPDWNVDKTSQQGQNQSWLMTLASSADKPSKTFDELMSTPIDFSTFSMNSLKINNLTQETLLGPVFRLLKGTHSNYAELEYDFEECYKALLEKLD
ncbi:hypothetical protein Tco_0099251 [Tanacetum coccineum]